MSYADGVDQIDRPTVRFWECPDGCGERRRTIRGGVITPMHRCPEHNGFDVPLQQAGRHGLLAPAQHIRFVDRGDMSNGDDVQLGGKMAVHSIRSDGSYDTIVFAPCARGTGRGESLHA